MLDGELEQDLEELEAVVHNQNPVGFCLRLDGLAEGALLQEERHEVGVSDLRDAVVGVDVVGEEAEEHCGDGRDAEVHRKVRLGSAPLQDPRDWDPADGLLVVPTLVAHRCWLGWCGVPRAVVIPYLVVIVLVWLFGGGVMEGMALRAGLILLWAWATHVRASETRRAGA